MPWPKGVKQSEEHRRKNSEGGRRAKSGDWMKEGTRERYAEAARNRVITPERRKNQSRAKKQQWLEGRMVCPDNMYKKSGGIHAGVWMRCLNSEGEFARQLDEAQIKWVYEPRRYKTSLGSYLPDFFLTEFNIYVDVKGTRPRPASFAKMDAFRREHGKCLIVVYQRELGCFYYRGGQ